MSAAGTHKTEAINQNLADRQREALGGRLTVNVVYNYIGFVVNLVTGLYLTRLLVSRLGDDLYGAWALIGSVMMYLGLVDLGFGSSVQKYVAEFAAAGEEDRISRLLTTTFLMFGGLGALLFLLSVAVTPLLGPVFKIEGASNIAQARWALALMGVVNGINLPIGVFAGALSGLQRMDINNKISIGGTALVLVLVSAFVNKGYGLVGVCVAYLIVNLTIAFIRYAALKRQLPGLRISIARFDRTIVRSTSTYGFTFFGLKIAQFLKYNTDNMVIAGFLSTAAVTPYAVASRLATVSRQLVEQALEVLVPIFSQLERLEDQDKIRQVYMQAGKMTVGIATPMTLFIAVFAHHILGAWLEEVPEKSVILTVILSLTVFASVIPAVSVRLLLGVARHKTLAFWTLGDSIANFILSIIFVQIYGVVGVALGTAIPLFISHLIVFPWLGCRQAGVPTHQFLFTLLRSCVLPLVPTGALVWAIYHWLPPHGFPMLILTGVVVVSVFAVLFAQISLTTDERRQYTARLRKLVPGSA